MLELDRRQILVADDNQYISEAIAAHLETLGLPPKQVKMVGTFREALASITQIPLLIRGIFLNPGLPDGDGTQLLQQLQRENPQIPVVVISGDPDPDIRDYCSRLGARAFLKKPFTTEDLATAIKFFD